MFIVNNYPLAVIFCFVTMLCWGSWGNTQKLASKSWRYELYYWDYVIGMVLFSLVSGFTLGSFGEEGRSFIPDLMQADLANLGSVLLGGVVFNASNILLSASVSLAEAVAFASKAAAIAVTRLGAQASVPQRAEVDAMMK